MTEVERCNHPRTKRRSVQRILVVSGRLELPIKILPWEWELVVGALRALSQGDARPSGSAVSPEGPNVEG